MDGEQRRSSFSVLQGDGLHFSRIISRESSVGQSSRIYYRPAEGVPFKWEMQPGTPKTQPEIEKFPPLSPPPQLQNQLLLPLHKQPPCLDDDDEKPPKNIIQKKFLSFLKKIRITELYDKAHQSLSISRTSCTGKELHPLFTTNQSDPDHFIINHSCSSSSSSTLSSSRNHGTAESSSLSSSSSSCLRRVSEDGPFCCSPWNITAIMEAGNRRVYYCRDHKTAFAIEKDGSFLGKIILSRVSSSSSVDRTSSFHFYPNLRSDGTGEGIPFQWEMQPGKPIDYNPSKQPEQQMIPPPTPPPALQSSLVAPLRPRPSNQISISKSRSRILFRNWIKTKKLMKKKTTTTTPAASVGTRYGVGEISFKLDDDTDRREHEYLSSGSRDSVSRSSSSSISISRLNSNEQLKLSTRLIGRDLFSGHSCFNFKS